MKKKISYEIKKSKRAKRVRLAVYCDGKVVVTSPVDADRTIVKKFVADKWQWVKEKVDFFQNVDTKNVRGFSYEDYLKHKDKAFELVKNKVEKFNQNYNFRYNKILIKNQKTRWGSCSKKRNLNFNYKIIFLKKELQDYIIVHELCHLKEFNHSNKFWALVEKGFPEYLGAREKIRQWKIS